jgi:hypothetical protein
MGRVCRSAGAPWSRPYHGGRRQIPGSGNASLVASRVALCDAVGSAPVGKRVVLCGRARLVGVLCLFILAAAPGAAAADTRYVASGGTDFGPCTQTQPCATIYHTEAISAPGDTIDVGPGTFTEHVPILQLFSPLTIRGAGATATTVSGGFSQAGSVFTVQPGASATIEDLAITGGQADNGGGVNDAGSLTLSNDVVALTPRPAPPRPRDSAAACMQERASAQCTSWTVRSCRTRQATPAAEFSWTTAK